MILHLNALHQDLKKLTTMIREFAKVIERISHRISEKWKEKQNNHNNFYSR